MSLLRGQGQEGEVVREIDLAFLRHLVSPADRLGERGLLRGCEPGGIAVLTFLRLERGTDRLPRVAERQRSEWQRRAERPDLHPAERGPDPRSPAREGGHPTRPPSRLDRR